MIRHPVARLSTPIPDLEAEAPRTGPYASSDPAVHQLATETEVSTTHRRSLGSRARFRSQRRRLTDCSDFTPTSLHTPTPRPKPWNRCAREHQHETVLIGSSMPQARASAHTRCPSAARFDRETEVPFSPRSARERCTARKTSHSRVPMRLRPPRPKPEHPSPRRSSRALGTLAIRVARPSDRIDPLAHTPTTASDVAAIDRSRPFDASSQDRTATIWRSRPQSELWIRLDTKEVQAPPCSSKTRHELDSIMSSGPSVMLPSQRTHALPRPRFGARTLLRTSYR